MRGLLDTSVLVGSESGRALGELPDEAALSVITLEELTLGGTWLANAGRRRWPASGSTPWIG